MLSTFFKGNNGNCVKQMFSKTQVSVFFIKNIENFKNKKKKDALSYFYIITCWQNSFSLHY